MPVEVKAPTLLALAKSDPLRLFEEYVRLFVEDYVGDVEGVGGRLLLPGGRPCGGLRR